MRLERAFYRLPLRFDRVRLQLEVERLMATPWLTHPTGFAGNSSLPLVSVAGGANDDFAISGPMQPTPALRSSPYLRQALSALGTPVTRCRLMRLEPGAEVPWHDDRNFHWFRRMRIHVPVFTEPAVLFDCGDQSVHMAAGEAWTFDNFRPHRVTHAGRAPRIHLVADTRGTPPVLRLLDTSGSPSRDHPFIDDAEMQPEIEPYEFEILDPEELTALTDELERDRRRLALAPRAIAAVQNAVEHLRAEYSRAFEQHGRNPAGEGEFQRILRDFQRNVIQHAPGLYPSSDALAVMGSMFARTNRRAGTHAASSGNTQAVALSPAVPSPESPLVRAGWFELRRSDQHLEILPRGQLEAVARVPGRLEPMLRTFDSPCTTAQARERMPPGGMETLRRDLALLESLDLLTAPGAESLRFDRPIIVVSAPRAGSTLLFELLARLPSVYTVGGESHSIIEGLPQLHPRSRAYISNRLSAADAPDWLGQVLRMRFARALVDRDGQRATDSRSISVRVIEKTPKNALRIPFLHRVFPDARFLFLHREAPASLGSLIEGWRSGRFVTYPKLPGWLGMPWSFLLTPNWRQLNPRAVAAIAAEQWAVSNDAILDALEALPRDCWLSVEYTELTRDPRATLERIQSWADLPVDPLALRSFEHPLPLSSFTLSMPASDKWKRYQSDIEAVLPRVAQASERLRER